jgi:hypothetical protein
MSDNSRFAIKKYKVKRSKIQGRGIFAATRIRRGQRIIEYIGERISSDEADLRYEDDTMDRHHTFLFSVDENIVIDAAQKGNSSRFINHSCAPNCEAVNEDGRIFIEAMRNIQPGIELTYDYSYEHEGKITEQDRKTYFCGCGSPDCRQTILKPSKPSRNNGSNGRNGSAKNKRR